MRFLITNSVPLNGGDEALLRATVETLRKRWPASEVMVLCKDVARCRAYLPDLDFASDLEWASSRRERRRTLDLYRAADVVLSASGGFLSDHYGIEDRLRGFETALDLGKPVVLFAQSIGPFWKADSLRRVPQVLNRVTAICTRDEASRTHLLECGVDDAKIHRTADAAFLWRNLAGDLFRTAARRRQIAGLCFRSWPLGDKVAVKETIRKAEELCRHILAEAGWEVLFVSPCQGIPGYVDDSLIALRVLANLPPELRTRCSIDRSRHAPRELMRVLGQCSAFMGMRLHASILAMLAGVPAAALGYEEKAGEIFRQLGLEEYQIPFQSDETAWIHCATRLFHDLASIRRRLPEALDALCTRAQWTVDIVGDQLLRTKARTTVSAEQRWAESVPRYDRPHLRLRQVAALVARLAPKRLLDVGCAAGHLRKLCPAGMEYVGCDFIPPASPVSFPLWRCNFNRDPLPAELTGFDAIVCSGILEYIEDVPSFLETLASRLSPGGHIVVTYFNMNHVSRLWDMLRGRSFAVHPDWRNFYSLRHIPRIVAAAGFRFTATIAMKHSFCGPEAVEDLVSAPLALPRSRWWSTWFAHQLIIVAQKSSIGPGAISPLSGKPATRQSPGTKSVREPHGSSGAVVPGQSPA